MRTDLTISLNRSNGNGAMDRMTSKMKQWIEQGNKDPRSARWQAALEEIMTLFIPLLEIGKLTPVSSLEEQDIPIFRSALAAVDLVRDCLPLFCPLPQLR